MTLEMSSRIQYLNYSMNMSQNNRFKEVVLAEAMRE
jgi:hypothetical protein